MRLTLLFLSYLVVSACTWVDLTPGAEKVKVLKIEDITTCNKKGTTTVSLRDQIAGVKRNKEKVRHELETLARNGAVKLKGNTLAPISEIEKGEQTFAIYYCRSN